MLNAQRVATSLYDTAGWHGLRRLVGYSLPVCMACTLAVMTAHLTLAVWPARIALLTYLASQWRWQSPLAKGLLLFGLITALAVVALRGDAATLLGQALDRFCFFATFVSSLGMLRVAALHSRLIREAGQALIQQRPSQRYPILALGSGLFGIIVNIGVLSLFGPLIQRSNSLRAAGGHEHVRTTRERRMMLAMLRGFGLVPLISPLAISLAVILSSMPYLSWSDIAPAALPSGMMLFLLGWLFDWLQRPRPSGVTLPENDAPSLAPFGRFSLLVAGITLSVFAVAGLFELALPVAVLIACPLSSFIWLAWQRRRLGGGSGAGRAASLLLRHAGPIFGASRTEVAIMGGSGFLGALIAPLIDTDRLGNILLASGLHGPAAAVAIMLLVVCLSQLGLNPIVSATLIIGVLPHPAVIGLHPVVLACALMYAWTLALLSSPFTAAMLILAGLTGRSTYAITWRWNGLYFLFILLLLTGCLYLLSTLYGGGFQPA